MCLECRDLFMCVIVEDPKLEVVGASHKPVLAWYKPNTPNRHLRDFKGFDKSTRLVVIDVDSSIV